MREDKRRDSMGVGEFAFWWLFGMSAYAVLFWAYRKRQDRKRAERERDRRRARRLHADSALHDPKILGHPSLWREFENDFYSGDDEPA